MLRAQALRGEEFGVYGVGGGVDFRIGMCGPRK